MIIDYVNTFLNLIQHPIFAAIAGLLGVAGVTVSGIIKGLKRSVKKYEISIEELNLRIKDQEKRIWNYENLVAKERGDLDLFLNLLPKEEERAHSIYHMLHTCGMRVASGKIKDSSNHISDQKQAISDTFSFLTESSALIARRRLISIQKYGCARHFTALRLMESLSGSIGLAHINSSESPDKALSIPVEEGDGNFDMREVDFLYDLSSKFHDVNSIDILISIKILDLEFLTRDNDEQLRRIKLNSLWPELRKVMKLSDGDFRSKFSTIPNTIVAVCIANDKSKTFSDEFEFGNEFLEEVERVSIEGGNLPELLKFMAVCDERYKNMQKPLFETFGTSINYKF